MANNQHSSPSIEPHIPALDGVRAIAIVAIIGVHATFMGAIPNPPPRFLSLLHILNFGWMGVDLFFVLSGFLITGILMDTRGFRNYFRAFYLRRALRILPLYYGILLLLLVVSPWVAHTWLGVLIPDHASWLAYFTYTYFWWRPHHQEAHVGVVGLPGFIIVEEQFYLIWPFLILLLSRQAFVRVCFVICTLAPALRLMLMYLNHNPQSEFVYSSIFTRIDTLAWGALAAVLVRSPPLLERLRPLLSYALAFTAAAVFIIAFPLGELYSRAWYTQSIGYTVIAIGCTSFILLAYAPETQFARALSHPLMRSLARYSYGMYVFHVLIVAAIRARFAQSLWYGQSIGKGFMLFVAVFLLPPPLAWLSYHLYEKHFLNLKEELAPQPNEQELPASAPSQSSL
jgi:peptidoglycan/LPS O-acetylase OafA/YrhL